jgi:hypothetical protein
MSSQGVVYLVVRHHFESFRAQAAGLRDGEGLPRFVEQEFRALLRCGCLAGGFARFRCDDCGLDRLVPFSCYPQRETMRSFWSAPDGELHETGCGVVDKTDQLQIVSSRGRAMPSGRNRHVYVFETDFGVINYPVGKLRGACPQL